MKLLVFLFILINSLIFTFVVPPFQKPDEDAKFYMTVALAQGQFSCHLNGKGEKVVSIPRKYYELPILFQTDELKFHADRKLSINLSEVRKQIDNLGYEIVETNKGCLSYFVGFIPNTIGFLLAAPINDPIIQFYFGRVAGFILFILAFWYALKIIPKPFHLILYLYGTLPMVLHQITAYNEDVLFLAMTPLVFSFLVKLYSEKIITMKHFLLYQVAIHLLVLAKPIAVPFIFLHLQFPRYLKSRSKNTFLKIGVIFFFLSIFLGLYFYNWRR